MLHRKSIIFSFREIRVRFAVDDSKVNKDETYSVLINPPVLEVSKKNDELNESKVVKKQMSSKLKLQQPVGSRKGSFLRVVFFNLANFIVFEGNGFTEEKNI